MATIEYIAPEERTADQPEAQQYQIKLTPEERKVHEIADWLDNKRPGWWNLIDLTAFDITEAPVCVFGQVFAGESSSGWLYGIRVFTEDYRDRYVAVEDADGVHFFDALGSFDAGPLWRTVIEDRIDGN